MILTSEKIVVNNHPYPMPKLLTMPSIKPRPFKPEILATAGLNDNDKLREVWRQKNRGTFNRVFKTDIWHHGVVMLRPFSSK